MTNYRFFISVVLVAVIVAACAPAASTDVPANPIVVEPSLTPTSAPVMEVTSTLEPVATAILVPLSPTPSSSVQPVATSRGPNLEASAPNTVKLASGGLQLVEFFRFT